jgi:hypothetical protein
MGKKEKKEKAKERREKRLQDIQLLRSIPYSDQQRYINNIKCQYFTNRRCLDTVEIMLQSTKIDFNQMPLD